MSISSIPGYVQGFRFSDDSQYWDSGNSRFIDQAGYGDFNGLTITAGTPAFVGSGATRGLTLDNTVQGKFLPAIPWDGACIVVMEPVSYDGTTKTLMPVILGVASSVSSNTYIGLSHASGTFTHRLATNSSQINASNAYTGAGNNGVKVGAFAVSQETRKGYYTKDGVTVSETAAVAAANAWVGMAGKDTARSDGLWARFGNISGVLDDVAILSTAHRITMYELHFFKGNPLITDAATVATEIAALKTQYGAT